MSRFEMLSIRPSLSRLAVFCASTLLVCFVFVVSPIHVRAVATISQVGADIDGEAAGDRLGWSVAMSGDGSRIAIGAYGSDGNGSGAGHVRVYTLIDGTWTQTGLDIDGEAADDGSGWSVAMSGDGSRIAIGAYGSDGNGSDAGHVRVYTLINGTWTRTGVDIDGEAAGDYSGSSVTMSGDGSRIAIGAINNDGNGSDAGHVRVYGVPTVPAAPTITSVVGTNGSLSVTFASGADGGSPITNYKYSIDGTNYIALNPVTTSSPFIISGLINATTYSVTIKAVNIIGDSLKSNTVNGTPIAPPAIVEPTTTTVAATTTTTVAKTLPVPVVKINKSTSAKSIAVFAKLTVASSSKVRLTVAGSSVKICKASGVSVRGIKVGMCKLKVTVTPKKGKPVSRNVSLRVSK